MQNDCIKIAFMFLITNDVKKTDLWQIFFNNADENKYTIFVNNKNNMQCNFFNKYIIKNRYIDTNWGNISIVKATIELLKTAYEDQNNKYFILLSDSCLPLYNFITIYNDIIKYDKSIISCYKNNNKYINMEYEFRQHQWMILDRNLAHFFINNNFFKEYENVILADEYYFINICKKNNLPFYDGTITYVKHYKYRTKKHGNTHEYKNNISYKQINNIRNKCVLFFRKVNDKCKFPKKYINDLLNSTIYDKCNIIKIDFY